MAHTMVTSSLAMTPSTRASSRGSPRTATKPRGQKSGKLDYEAGGGFWKTVCAFEGTSLPHIICSWDFWCVYMIHLAIYCAHHLGWISPEWDFGVRREDLSAISTITAITISLHTKNVYEEYLVMYKCMRETVMCFENMCSILHLHLAKQSRQQHARVALRYLFVSTQLGFAKLDRDGCDTCWQSVVARGLVTSEERAFIEPLNKHDRFLIVRIWTAEVAYRGMEELGVRISVFSSYMHNLNAARMAQQGIMDNLTMPINFQYIHFLYIMMGVSLLFWGYTVAVDGSFFGPALYLFGEAVALSMLKLANELSCPIGDHDMCFPIDEWLSELYDHAVVTMEQEYPDSRDGWRASLASEVPLDAKFCRSLIVLDCNGRREPPEPREFIESL